jgi:hypothetical protein
MENSDPNAYIKMLCGRLISAIENDDFRLFSRLFDNFLAPENTNYDYLLELSTKRSNNLIENLKSLNESNWNVFPWNILGYPSKMCQLYISKNNINYQGKINELIKEKKQEYIKTIT